MRIPYARSMFLFRKSRGVAAAKVSPAAVARTSPISEPISCYAGNLIDLSFSRMCDVMIVHAGEPGMDDHFREALLAAMEEMLRHRRECEKCSQFFAALQRHEKDGNTDSK